MVARCQASVELTQDSPNFGAELAGTMTRALAVELDRVGLAGTGIDPEPLGILGTPGRGVVSGVSTVSDYGDILTGVKQLLTQNITLDEATRALILSPYAWLA